LTYIGTSSRIEAEVAHPTIAWIQAAIERAKLSTIHETPEEQRIDENRWLIRVVVVVAIRTCCGSARSNDAE